MSKKIPRITLSSNYVYRVHVERYYVTSQSSEGMLKNAKSFTLLGHLGAGKIPAKEIATQVREALLLMLVTMNCNEAERK